MTTLEQAVSKPFPCSNFTGKERDEEKERSRGPFASERGDEPRSGIPYCSVYSYTYFGARYMDHELMTMWLSVDPMVDKYSGISSYAYCAWNPVKLVDPDGREVNPVYDLNGKFLGNTKEGFTGEPIISKQDALELCTDLYGVSDVSELSKEQVLSAFGESFDAMERRECLSQQAQENIYNDIVSRMEGTHVYGYTFSMKEINEKIKYYIKSKNNSGNLGTNVKTSTVYINHQYDYYETTVENIQASVVYHEWLGHIIMGWGNGNQYAKASDGGTHYMCYLAVISSPLFKSTTTLYQNFNYQMLNQFFQ